MSRKKLKILKRGENIIISFFSVALRLDTWSWPPLTGLQDHTHWAHQTS